ncbi:MAG: hypothetical protein LBO74_15220 [Candidatus Symbiothrix sp.]|jgi:hypothetical protein|nr:hypothetical protein [Candidatus Symbiothrix sp.]
MTKETAIKLFEEKQIRTHWDEQSEEWYFSVIDVVSVLTDSSNSLLFYFFNFTVAALTDYHRNISGIQYNVLNLPDQIALGDQEALYSYDASGVSVK